MKTSICLATYNGEKYIKEQLLSVLNQLNQNDEIIIVDDCSLDRTLEYIEKLNDKRIRIFQNKKNSGHVLAFEKAISKAKGDIIFLCDQDDVWLNDKIQRYKDEFKKGADCIVSAYYEWDPSTGKSNLQLINLSSNLIYNFFFLFIGKMKHLGCCMAFRKESIERSMPFPKIIDAHDRWLMLHFIIKKKSIAYIRSPMIRHRIHSKNTTPEKRRSIIIVLRSRIIMLYYTIKLFIQKNE